MPLPKNSLYFLRLLCTINLFCFPALGQTKQVPKNSFESLWFKGSVEEAFIQSKKLNKPVFLYWGAVWCPPCNELKSQVFPKKKFRQLINSVIPVYLDGDTDTAQKWGEKLKIGGYPTLLLLDNNNKELLRIVESLNIDEFEQAFLAAIALQKPIKEIINEALSKDVSPQVWQALAYTHWEQMGDNIFDDAKLLEISVKLLEKSPTKLRELKSVLAGKILKLAARVSQTKGQPPEIQNLLRQVTKNAASLFGHIFESDETILASRSVILYDANKILSWSSSHISKPQLEKVYTKWENAAKRINTSSESSIDSKLWATYVPLRLHRLRHGDSAPFTNDMLTSIKNAVKDADKEAKTVFERKSVVTGAAYLLRKIEAYGEAKELLEKELQESKTPWYIQSSLSRLEEVQGNHKKALFWSTKARESALGNATKIQWTVSDLLLTIKLEPTELVKIERLLEEYFKLAFSQRDGFLGRNQVRANKVLRGIKSLASSKKLSTASLKKRKKCQLLKSKNAENCEQFFKGLEKTSTAI